MSLLNKREYLYRTLLVLTSIAVSLIIIECILSSDYFSQNFKSSGKTNNNQAAQYVHHPAPWYSSLEIKSVDMHSILEPFSEDYQFGARHNSQGFRTPEYTIAKPPETFRIVVIGDSFTWGQGVKLEETFSYKLNELFKNKYSGKKKSVEVIALGVCGSRLIDNFIRLKAHAKALNPDLIIFQFLQNDLQYYSYCKYLIPKDFVKNFSKYSSIGKYLNKTRQSALYANEEKKMYDPKSFEWNFFVSGLSEMKQWKNQNKAELFFISFPSLNSYKNGIDFSEYAKKTDITFFQDTAVAEISKAGFNVLNLFDTYKKHAERNYLFVSETDCHPSAFAHKIVANALFDYLIENKYIKFTPQLQNKTKSLWENESLLRQEAAENWADYNKSYEKQLLLYKELKKIYPENLWVTSQLAFVYKQIGEYEKSYAMYESLISISPEVAAPWYQMSHCVNNDVDKEKLLKQMLKIVPDNSNAMERLAEIYKNNNRIAEAYRYYYHIAAIPRYPEQLDRAIKEIETLSQ